MHSFPQQNYQFLKKCVEIGPVTPMHQKWFNNILLLIPESLRAKKIFEEPINDLFNEIREDFNQSMKKSMGLFFIFSF